MAQHSQIPRILEYAEPAIKLFHIVYCRSTLATFPVSWDHHCVRLQAEKNSQSLHIWKLKHFVGILLNGIAFPLICCFLLGIIGIDLVGQSLLAGTFCISLGLPYLAQDMFYHREEIVEWVNSLLDWEQELCQSIIS